MGFILHLNLSVEAVRTTTPPSSKLTYIDWLSQEYVAYVIGTVASRGNHCQKQYSFKISAHNRSTGNKASLQKRSK